MIAQFILKDFFPFTKLFPLYGSRINVLGTFPVPSIYLKRFPCQENSGSEVINLMKRTYNWEFWRISGVEHLPTIFTGMGGIHQMPRLNSSCVITSNQMKVPLKPRVRIPERANTQHMAT